MSAIEKVCDDSRQGVCRERDVFCEERGCDN